MPRSLRIIDMLRHRLRSLFSRKRVEQELAEELRLHVEEQVAANVRGGMNAA